MAESKNKNTLYRFVSLRNPELSKKENQEVRFVFHPLNDEPLSTLSTKFFLAIKDKVATKSKWQALQEFCISFETANPPNLAAFKIEGQLKDLNEDFYLIADWLAINKTKLTASEIFTKVDTVTNLIDTDALIVWDNLFYQTITQKSFYIKENCIQMLVLHNLKKKIIGLTQANAIKIIKQLTDARVVLPTSLFEESETYIEQTSQARLSEANQNLSLSREMIDNQDKIIANFQIEDYQRLIKNLEKVQNKYDKEKGLAYNKEYQDHQSKVSPLISAYQKEYNKMKRELCKIPRDATYDPDDFCNQPDLEYPELPAFEFSYPTMSESKFLQSNLTEESLEMLTRLVDILELDHVKDAIELVKQKINEQHEIIVSKTVFSKTVMVIGDMVVPTTTASKLDSLGITVCSLRSNNTVTFKITVGGTTTPFAITKFEFKLTFNNGLPELEDIVLSQTSINNLIGYNNLFFDALVSASQYGNLITISGKATFSDGSIKTFNTAPPKLGACTKASLIVSSNGANNNLPTQDSFIPKGFGYRQLGIADYRKVVSHVCCYEAGEVAHIENIMAREFKEKTTEKVYSKEVTNFSSSETESESVSDTTSTDRFEMQTEIAKLLQEDKQFGAYANFKASWGAVGTGYQLDAGANYATNTSKEESNRQAITQAKELTQRAMERIVTRVRTEKTVKVTESFTDKNSHIFDNRSGGEHVSGVYRFINAIYKNQIFNYGKRLMYEFMIPQPSALHRLGMKVSNANVNAIILDRPIDPRIDYPTFESINEGNYKILASKYDIVVDLLKNQIAFNATKHDGQWSENGGKWLRVSGMDVAIPDGYKVANVKGNIRFKNGDHEATWNNLSSHIQIGTQVIYNDRDNYPDRLQVNLNISFTDDIINKLTILITSWDIGVFNYDLILTCTLTNHAYQEWQKETYQAIIDGYNAQVEAYNQQEAAAKAQGVAMLDSNPGFYRQTEQLILKKNAISYLIDSSSTSRRKMGLPMYNNNATFIDYQVTLNQDMDNYTSFVKFMEQAFDWNIMSYNFYPFYWGNANDWDELYQYDSNDPLFRSFMQAGMARVVVTVKPGFEEAVMHYMKFGQIWNGGQMPVIGNPLYLSIVDELKEQEYEVDETWETVVPTNLVALQASGVALDEHGLPCGDGCESDVKTKFKPSKAKLEAIPVKPV